MVRRTSVVLCAIGALAPPLSAQPGEGELAIITPPAAPNASFGSCVARGETLWAIGAELDQPPGSARTGVVRVYNDDAALLHELFPADAPENALFGASIAIDAGVIAVGAPGDDDAGVFSGSVFLFDAITGAELGKITPDDHGALDNFGFSVDLAHGTLAVGAIGESERGQRAGAVYVFDVLSGAQRAKLLADDAFPDDLLGWSVALGPGVVLAGAIGRDDAGSGSGAVYIFDDDGGSQTRIVPHDAGAGDMFGISIDTHDARAVVGASGHGALGPDSGAAYLIDPTAPSVGAKLLASDGSADDQFGQRVGISGTKVAVGAPFDDNENGLFAGAVYTFDAQSAAPIAKLLTSDGITGDRFGTGLALDEDLVCAGSPLHDSTGAAYLFDPRTGLACNEADIEEPIGELTFLDVAAFVVYEPDINDDGFFSFADAGAFLAAFAAGCP